MSTETMIDGKGWIEGWWGQVRRWANKAALAAALLVTLSGFACLDPTARLELEQLTATAQMQNSYLAVIRDLNDMRASGLLSDDDFRQVDPHVQAAKLYRKAMKAARGDGDDVAFKMAQRNFDQALADMVYWRNRLAGG